VICGVFGSHSPSLVTRLVLGNVIAEVVVEIELVKDVSRTEVRHVL
jgi:hypothetical protein